MVRYKRKMSITVPGDIRDRMSDDSFKDVNWSAIASKAFEEAMDLYQQNKLKNIDSQLYKLTKEREEVVKGIVNAS